MITVAEITVVASVAWRLLIPVTGSARKSIGRRGRTTADGRGVITRTWFAEIGCTRLYMYASISLLLSTSLHRAGHRRGGGGRGGRGRGRERSACTLGGDLLSGRKHATRRKRRTNRVGGIELSRTVQVVAAPSSRAEIRISPERTATRGSRAVR